MAIGNHNDLTHIVRTSDQWKNTYDKYELIPSGVLCVELVSSDVTKIKIGDGHNIFSKLPYIGDLDLSKYYTKLETDTRIKEILTQEKVVRIKGLIGSKSDLPADARCGDIYFVRQLSSSDNKYIEYIYSPDNTWEPLGGIPVDIDLSEYAKTAYVDDKIEQVNERIDDIEQHGTHTHPNKEILDQITEPYTTADKETLASLHNYDDTEIREMISQSSHTHSNKDILDATSAAFTKEDKSKLDQLNPYDDSTIKERITELERVAHEHSNKRILDQTTASFTKEYERKMRWIRMYTGCTGMEEGIAGLVPAAQAGEEDYVLSGSGEWVPQTGGGGTYELPIATASTLGGIKVGDGLEIDENGKLSVVGGGGGDSIAEGDGITITTDPQTGVKTISVNTGDHLEVDENTGELNVTDVDYTAGHGIHIGADYTLIEYIKNSGSYDQIILTDIIPSSTDRFEMDVKFGAATGLGNNKPIYGAVGTNQGYYNAIWIDNTNNYNSISVYNHFAWQSGRTSNQINANDTIKYEGNNPRQLLTVTRNTATWGNVTANFSDQIDSSLSELTVPIAIFGRNIYNTGFAEFTMMELFVYGVKLYDSNDTLLHDLRPAERGTDGEAGLYDLVTHKFYGNAGNGSFVKGPPVSSVDDRLISAKIGNGLQFDSNDAIEVVTGNGLSVNQDNELEVNTGNGLQINQDGELEIDPSIIPEVPNLIPGKAIEFEHESSHLQLTDFSNNDFIASVTSMNNGTFSRPADNSSITISSSSYDCYTKGIGGDGGSSGSYAYTVKPNTQYRLMWDSSDTTISGNTIIFENAGYNRMHSVDQAIASYIDFTTGPNCSFFSTRFGIANPNQTITFSNIRLYEYVEDTFESDKINVKYNKGLNINRDNELEVVLSDGLQFDLTASETMVADEMYLFDSQVTCQVYGYWQSSSKEYRTFTKLNPEPALCCLWEVGNGGSLWTGPLFVGLTAASVQYSSDIQASVSYQNTFNYLGKTWYTSGYPDFLSDADHEDKLEHLQYLGSYAAVTDQIQAAKDLIDLANVRFVSNAGIQAKLGNGLQFDSNDAIEVNTGNGLQINQDGELEIDPSIIPDSYEAGNGIEITEVTHEDEFRVQNQEYFFDTHGLTCGLNARVWTTVNDGDILAAMCIHNNGGNQVPLFVGLTEDSVKVSQNYDSNILGPNGSFDYHGKTWYFTADYALSGTDGQDTQGHIQTLPTTYSFNSTPSNFVPAAKDLIDLAVLLSDLEYPVISVKYNKGLTLNQDNELEVNIGTGLEIDPQTGAINVTGGSGGDTIAEGDGITITTDSQTGIKTIGINVGNGLDIDPITNELFVDGQLPEGTIIKKLTYVGNGEANNIIQFTKKPLGILALYGQAGGTAKGCAVPTVIDATCLLCTWGSYTQSATERGGVVSCLMSYNDSTNELTLSQGMDIGSIFNISGETYTMFYLTKGHTGSGTSETNMVSVVKTFSYVGTGTSTNNIQFPETPDMLLSIAGIGGDNTYLTTTPTPMDAAKLDFAISDGSNNNGVGGALMSFNDTTNVLTLTSSRYDSWAFNTSGVTYQVRYIVNEVIASSIGSGTNYIPGEGIEFTELSNSLYANKVRMEITGIKSYSQSGSYAPYVQMRYLEFSDENHDEITLTSGTGIWDDGTPVEYPNPGESIDAMIAEMIANTGKMIATKFNGTKSLILTFDLSAPVSYDDLQYLRYKTGNDAPERDPISWKIYFNNTNSVNNWNLAAVVESATITNNREAWTQYFPLAVNEFNTVVISATGGSGSGDTVAEGNGISINTDQQTGEKVISVDIGSGLAFDPQTGAINVTTGSGDTVAEGAGIDITTDQQTGDKVIAINPGAGLQVNQTTNELEVSSGVVTSIAPTQNTPGSITVTEGDGTATPVSVISQMGGATSSTAGTAGYVPAPAAGDDDAYLRGDGTWDDSVVTEDDELTLVFVPDDYQPS